MRIQKKIFLLPLLAAFVALTSRPALCDDAAPRLMSTQSPQVIELVLGKSVIVKSETENKRV